MADKNIVNETVLTEKNNWKASFTNLPVNKDGKEITYAIEEVEVANYTVKITENNGNFKIINSHTPELTNITVKKVWVDDNDNDGLRPEFVTVDVLADGVKVQTVTVKGDDWTYTVSGLPKYADGKEIVYTVEEVGSPKGYTTSVEGLTITNTHVPEVTNVSVAKVWNDSDNRDGVRPGNVNITLYADGVEYSTVQVNGTNWNYTFTNLPKYNNTKLIVFTVGEGSVEGYDSARVYCNGTYKFINTHIPMVTEINISKIWMDKDNQDGIRPEAITVDILADGAKVQTITIGSEDGWTSSVKDLPMYKDGKLVEYSVNESVIPYGYNATINGFNITNTHIPDVTQVKVTKVWNDTDNQDGKRTNNVTVTLYANKYKVNDVVLNQSNDWTYTFINLPKYANGSIIVYTVDESVVPDGYYKNITNCGSCYKIINTYRPVFTNITVNKVWNDSDNNDGIRPGEVFVDVLAYGNIVQSVILNADNGWTYVVSDLPVYKNGVRVLYTLSESKCLKVII